MEAEWPVEGINWVKKYTKWALRFSSDTQTFVIFIKF